MMSQSRVAREPNIGDEFQGNQAVIVQPLHEAGSYVAQRPCYYGFGLAFGLGHYQVPRSPTTPD